MKEESWRNLEPPERHVGAYKSYLKAYSETCDAAGCICRHLGGAERHLEPSGRHLEAEAPGRHPGGTQETSMSTQRHPDPPKGQLGDKVC